MRLWLLSIITLWLYCHCNAYKILACFPFPGKSHNLVWDPLLKELANRGHQVTAVKAFPLDDPPKNNYNEIIIKDILSDLAQQFGNKNSFTRQNLFDRMKMMFLFKSSGLMMGEKWIQEPRVKEIINSKETYDAVLYESSLSQEFFTTFQHKFNAVGIEVQTVGNYLWGYWLMGNHLDTSYIVDSMVGYSDRMTLLERLHLTVQSALQRFIWMVYYMPKYQAFMDQHIRYEGWESRPKIVDMVINTSLVLINSDIALTYPHPMAPHFIEIGGINVLPNKPLPKDLNEFMDGAEHGVIYFTLGSHIQMSSTLGDSLRDEFAKAFAKLKQRVLWKWETKNFKNPPSNVKISKWFPQQDILAHKNLKLFISHGGFLSVTESIHFGVPMVGIPIFADQDKNINFVQNKGVGVLLDFSNLTESSIYWAINQVINNKRYKEAAMHQSNILRDKPQTPLERAVFWTEYVIRHRGAQHLKPALATMPWYQQAMLDVYGVIAIIALLPFIAVYFLFKIIIKLIKRFCCSSGKQNKKSKVKRQ